VVFHCLRVFILNLIPAKKNQTRHSDVTGTESSKSEPRPQTDRHISERPGCRGNRNRQTDQCQTENTQTTWKHNRLHTLHDQTGNHRRTNKTFKDILKPIQLCTNWDFSNIKKTQTDQTVDALNKLLSRPIFDFIPLVVWPGRQQLGRGLSFSSDHQVT
jgi:hypothetical protein